MSFLLAVAQYVGAAVLGWAAVGLVGHAAQSAVESAFVQDLDHIFVVRAIGHAVWIVFLHPTSGAMTFGLPILLTVGMVVMAILRGADRGGPAPVAVAGSVTGLALFLWLAPDWIAPMAAGPGGPGSKFHMSAALFHACGFAWAGAAHALAFWLVLRLLRPAAGRTP